MRQDDPKGDATDDPWRERAQDAQRQGGEP